MYKVVKRDGSVVDFNLFKISNAIAKAFESVDCNYDKDVIDFLALKVTADFQGKVVDEKISVEDIQDSVESVLAKAGYSDVAKSYILYRKLHEKQRNIKSTVLDYKKLVDNYVQINDWRVKENSTVTYSLGGLILSNSGAITANYWLSEIYDEEIAQAHKNADIHIHDLSMLSGYCAGWSLKQLIKEGLGGITGKITSSPARHLSTLCNQMVNFLGIMQNEWAGAQAFSSFDTYLAPYVKKDNLSNTVSGAGETVIDNNVNAVESAVVMCTGDEIKMEDLPRALRSQGEEKVISIPIGITMDEAEKIIIQENLAANKGNKSRTADILGIGRKTLHRKLEELNIE